MATARGVPAMCTARVACDGTDLPYEAVCKRCRLTLERRARAAKDQLRIDKLLKQAEKPLPEDKRLFAGEGARKHWDHRAMRTRKAKETTNEETK